MTDDVKTKLRISAILFKNHVPVEEAKFIGKYIEDLEEKNRMLVQMERNTYETSQEIMAELTSEKQELIDYLKNEDADLKENVVIFEKKLRSTSKESFYYNSYLKTLHRFRAKRELIKEILSKIERGNI